MGGACRGPCRHKRYRRPTIPFDRKEGLRRRESPERYYGALRCLCLGSVCLLEEAIAEVISVVFDRAEDAFRSGTLDALNNGESS